MNDQFVRRDYTVSSAKIDHPLRIALLTDLHQSRYGERSEVLLQAIEEANPDLVVFGGDMTDMRADLAVLRELVAQLTDNYPLAFVAGNHEVWTEQLVEIKEMVASYGGMVLEGDCVEMNLRDQLISVCGLDDPVVGSKRYTIQREQLLAAAPSQNFSLLISHRPEWRRIEPFVEAGFDLILSGHAHGGQIRIPGLLNGIYAPNQGLFPRISGGEYLHEQTVQIVSRGLTKNSFGFPRIFNQPELVMIELIPLGSN